MCVISVVALFNISVAKLILMNHALHVMTKSGLLPILQHGNFLEAHLYLKFACHRYISLYLAHARTSLRMNHTLQILKKVDVFNLLAWSIFRGPSTAYMNWRKKYAMDLQLLFISILAMQFF
jgi:hypothetical protein